MTGIFGRSTIISVESSLRKRGAYKIYPHAQKTPVFVGITSGFSLVELSIVLVILGLLTGGILTGQNLIRAAELRSVITEYQAYQTAVMTFRDRYFALPGDMRNATDFWGSAGGSGTLTDGCETATGIGTETCNGSGNGLISGTTSSNQYSEPFTFWQHLSSSGLIQGQYSGRSGTGAAGHATAGINIPSSKSGNTGWFIFNAPSIPAGHWQIPYGSGVFYVGGITANSPPTTKVFMPEEIWGIDKKVDDGKPGQGNVGTLNWNDDCSNASSATDFEADYELILSTQECLIAFRNAL